MSYYTKITKAGLAAITAAMNNNSKVPISYMAFGDGNGFIPEPNDNANSLVNEVYRVGVNKVEIHEKNQNWLVCEAIIPSAVGGFNIREVALYDITGTTMLAIANYPPTYKPSVTEGAARIQTIRIVIQVDNTGNFELVIDPDVVLATVQMLEQYKKDGIVTVNSVEDLLKINPKNRMRITTLSFHTTILESNPEFLGGASYIYDSNQAQINNGGTIINGWVLIPENNTITPYHFGWAGRNSAKDIEAFQKCFDAVKNGQTILFWHTAHLEKQIGKHSDIYGADGRSLGHLTLNGGQPCLILRSKKNVTVILANAELYTETACQGLIDLYKCNRCEVRAGKLTGGNYIRETQTYKFPPIDGATGHAEKGSSTTGFNTTTLSPDIGGMSNNMVVTQNESSGGYGGQFPQFGGGTSQTWGIWRGGQLGNHSEGIRVIGGFGNKIEQNEIHGFNGSSIRLGLLRSLDGLIDYPRISTPESRAVAPKKTLIRENHLHDCYIGGCHQDRAVDTVFELNDVENMGHKDASIAHANVDPGYGFSTSRSMPNFGFKVKDNKFNNCYRKGIDCHQGSQFWIERNVVRGTMFHGIGIAVDDDYADIEYQPYFEHFSVISDNDIEAHECGIFYANGQFGRKRMEDQKKQWEHLHVAIRNNLIKSINPFFYNFGHSPFELTGNTFIFAAPYKHQKPVTGNKACVYLGSYNRGLASGTIISKNKFFNSKDGNFAYMIYFENGTGVNKAIQVVNNHFDITPWFFKEGANSMYLHNDVQYRSGYSTTPITYSSGKMIQDSVIEENTVWNDLNHEFILTKNGGGSGFVAYPMIYGDGRIVSVQILSGGSGYDAGTTITVRNKGRSSGATFSPVITNGVITAVNVLTQGCFYRSSYNLSVPRGLVRYHMNHISGASCYDEGIGSNTDSGCVLSVMKNDLSVLENPFAVNGSIRYMQTKLTGQYAIHSGGINGGTLMFWFSIEKYQETNGALFIANQSIDENTNASGATIVSSLIDGFKLDNLSVLINGNTYQGELLEYGKPYFLGMSSPGLSGNNIVFGSNTLFNGAFLNARYSLIQIHRGYTYSNAELLDTYNLQKSLFSTTL